MSRGNLFLWVVQLIQIVQIYINAPKTSPYYEKGLGEIRRILEKTYNQVENKYYKYILEPELIYYLRNERNSD